MTKRFVLVTNPRNKPSVLDLKTLRAAPFESLDAAKITLGRCEKTPRLFKNYYTTAATIVNITD